MKADLVIRGGTVVDGTGQAPQMADVVVSEGRITEIGRVPESADCPALDARGLAVTPGFIDVHSHSDFTLIVDPRAVSSVTQGVTLEIVGNCGHGCAPIADPEIAKMNIYGYHSGYPIDWRTMGQYLEAIQTRRPAVNVAALVPNGNLRLAAVGLADRPANQEEILNMKRLLEQSLEEGGLGFSTGLEYGTERGCSEVEIADLCRVLTKTGGVYATHTRNEFGKSRESIEEAIRTAETSGVPLQISHISVAARLDDDPRPAVEEALSLVEKARARGMDVAYDMHTRDYGITNLSAILPPWAMEGGKSRLEERLRDPGIRQKLKAYPNIVVSEARGRWDKIVLFDCKAEPSYSRRSIADVSASRGSEPLDTIYDILLAEIDNLHEVLVIELIYNESDLRLPFEYPACMVGSDATAIATDGPLGDRCFHGAYTWAAWFFRHYVREKQTLTLQEVVRRLTSLPAERFGIKDRGVLRRGAWADVAVLDPARFGERGTVFDPNQIAEGMRHVLVNGTVTMRNGQLTGHRNGCVVTGG
jgi:N-acyl-D-aspartate/D-glutamate deacylase